MRFVFVVSGEYVYFIYLFPVFPVFILVHNLYCSWILLQIAALISSFVAWSLLNFCPYIFFTMSVGWLVLMSGVVVYCTDVS